MAHLLVRTTPHHTVLVAAHPEEAAAAREALTATGHRWESFPGDAAGVAVALGVTYDTVLACRDLERAGHTFGWHAEQPERDRLSRGVGVRIPGSVDDELWA
ncbi:hypothetical protein [Cellulomonas endophytica]|uniref:hypothetical protein n=1 Tax=Cellulomonas endophytica TaxID=2494735 RepID=UPI001013A5B5|nr:hypothetical protein [Cellulomonas endophytica]